MTKRLDNPAVVIRSVCAVFLLLASILLPLTANAEEKEISRWRSISIGDSRLVAQELRTSDGLEELVYEAAQQAIEEEGAGQTAANDFWLTVIDARDSHDPRIANYRGSQPVYPASVVKLSYMLTAYDQLYTGRIDWSEALAEDLEQMIFVSDNKATNRVLDRVTNTTFGPALEGEARASFEHKRQTVVRYMEKLSLGGLVPTNKTFDADIPLYGRDLQWLGSPQGDNYETSNKMTTADTARLLYLVWRHGVVDYEACEEMLELLRRHEDKNSTYFSEIVPEGVTLYSKDGATGLCRHDAGIFELPEGGAIIVVAFSKTRHVEDDDRAEVIEFAADYVLTELRKESGVLDRVEKEGGEGDEGEEED